MFNVVYVAVNRAEWHSNSGMTPEELRRRRENDSIALRKQKRDEQLSKRRNMDVTEETDQLSAEVRKFVRVEFVQYWREKD